MHKTADFRYGPGAAGVLLALLLLLWGCAGVAQQRSVPPPQPASPSTTRAAERSASSSSSTEIRSNSSKQLIDASISEDPALDKILEPYSAKVRSLEVVIGRLEGELGRNGPGAGSLGNFVADSIRAQASIKLGHRVDLAVTNGGGLRKNAIYPGDLRVSDIWELLPFENKLIELEMTGEQLLKVFEILASGRDAQSGAIIHYRTGADKRAVLVSATLIGDDGKRSPIDLTATYSVVTIDYLLNVSGGNLSIFQRARTRKPLEITIRDAVIQYVKAETAAGRPIESKLDGRFSPEGSAEKMEEPR